jgi:hypothetical protein
MTRIRYIGAGESQDDKIAGTGLTWNRRQTLEVEPKRAGQLLQHTDVWEVVGKDRETKENDRNEAEQAYWVYLTELRDKCDKLDQRTSPRMNIQSLELIIKDTKEWMESGDFDKALAHG